MPTIIKKVKEEAEKKGAKTAIEKVKSDLVSVSGTDAPPIKSRADQSHETVVLGGSTRDFAELYKKQIIHKR